LRLSRCESRSRSPTPTCLCVRCRIRSRRLDEQTPIQYWPWRSSLWHGARNSSTDSRTDFGSLKNVSLRHCPMPTGPESTKSSGQISIKAHVRRSRIALPNTSLDPCYAINLISESGSTVIGLGPETEPNRFDLQTTSTLNQTPPTNPL
jgi:hypothetical protein